MEYSESTTSIILRGLHNEIYRKFRGRIVVVHSGAFGRHEGEDGGSAARSAVRRQRADENRNARRISKETENGKTTYEAETTVNGKSRDVSFDKTGAIVAVEQEVDLDSIPAAGENGYSEEDRHGHAEESGIGHGREGRQL